LGFADSFAYETPADVFREHAALSDFEYDGSRDFDIGAFDDEPAAVLPASDDLDIAALLAKASGAAEPAAEVVPSAALEPEPAPAPIIATPVVEPLAAPVSARIRASPVWCSSSSSISKMN
jgi:hypothetical protein